MRRTDRIFRREAKRGQFYYVCCYLVLLVGCRLGNIKITFFLCCESKIQRMPTCYCGTGVPVQYMYYLIKLPAAWLRTLSLYASSFFGGVRVGWSLSSSKYSSDWANKRISAVNECIFAESDGVKILT